MKSSTTTDRRKRYENAHRSFRNSDRHRSTKDRHKNRPAGRTFVGVDGEGGTDPSSGRHVYYLLRAGDDLLYTGAPLSSYECLRFLAMLPTKGITYVGFAFEYDMTMILSELPEPKLRELVDRESRRIDIAVGDKVRRVYRPVYWEDFAIDWIPRKEFRIQWRGDHHTKPGQGRWVSVSDVFGHFQCSFVKALEQWNIGSPELRAEIAADKARRSEFGVPTAREIEYNRDECRLLAELMDAVRAACDEAGIRPQKWQGAGYLASALLKKHNSPKHNDIVAVTPPSVWDAAQKAFYGGHSEVTVFGPSAVHEYDLQSAYPAAMVDLPCLECGTWHEGADWSVKHDLSLSYVRWHTIHDNNLGPFPVRLPSGRIVFPLAGEGWYWQPEIDAAERMGFTVERARSFHYDVTCHHRPFDWIPGVFAERAHLGRSGKGMVLKFALNSLYGKTAQSRPEPGPYTNWIYAGMITSITRAKAITLCTEHNGHCYRMIATDGVYLTHEVDVDCTPDRLGAWEHEYAPDFFAIMPGMYKKGDKLKTRGIPQTTVRSVIDTLISLWNTGKGAAVITHRTQFHAIRICLHRNRLDLLGQWVQVAKQIRIQWEPKRIPTGPPVPSAGGMKLFTDPPAGPMKSLTYRYECDAEAERRLAVWELEGQLDGIAADDPLAELEPAE